VTTSKELLRIAVVGTSHVLTLFEGYEVIAGELPSTLELAFIAQGPLRIGHAVVSPAGFERREPTGTLVDMVGESGATHVFVTWKGSQVNIRGLLLQGPAFDVVLPADGERLADAGVELIPCSVVESYVRKTLDREDDLSRLIERAQRRGAKVWMLGPPPVLPEMAVRERLGSESHFAARLGEIGLTAADVFIVPEAVRVRLRELLLGVYREFASEHGAGFCRPPSAVADEAGLLLPRYWGKDITHGNAAYGAAYLRDLVTVAAANRD
jgi:hypothetical protein